MNAPSPQTSVPRMWRSLRWILVGLESLIAAFLVLLALAANITFFREPVSLLVEFHVLASQEVSWLNIITVGLLFVISVPLLFLAAWRMQRCSLGHTAIGLLVLGGILAYLAHDDPTIHHPLALEELSPVFPGAETSYRVLMRYGKNQPAAKGFKAPRFQNSYPVLSPEPVAKWRETITTHRTELEQHWVALASERQWWAELNSFDRIGDLTPARADAEILGFTVVRALAQHGVAIASLQAIDGKGEEAIDTLIPLLRVSRKLQPGSRTLVTTMIAVVIEHISMQTAVFVLDTTPVSTEAKVRLRAVLQGGNVEADARHLLAVQYAFQLNTFGQASLGELCDPSGGPRLPAWRRALLDAVGPFVYNRRATFNRMGDLHFDLQDMAARRQIAQMEPRMKLFQKQAVQPTFKNFYGGQLMSSLVPAYDKVTTALWRNYDERMALLDRLSRP